MSRQTIERYFPGSLSLCELQNLTKTLFQRGIHPKNTLITYSLCVDEIEHRIERTISEIWGEPFTFGGLAGFPFVSTTGMGAAISHVPENGYLFIVYGPHVGISQNDVVGLIERRGLDHLSTACGAAIAALKDVKNGNIAPIPGDNQQNYIKRVVNRYYDQINNSQVKLPYAIYRQIEKDLFHLIRENLKVPVVLLGGININTEHTDYFKVLNFQIVYPDGSCKNL